MCCAQLGTRIQPHLHLPGGRLHRDDEVLGDGELHLLLLAALLAQVEGGELAQGEQGVDQNLAAPAQHQHLVVTGQAGDGGQGELELADGHAQPPVPGGQG